MSSNPGITNANLSRQILNKSYIRASLERSTKRHFEFIFLLRSDLVTFGQRIINTFIAVVGQILGACDEIRTRVLTLEAEARIV